MRERPGSRNPHRLTHKQHTLPRALIQRYAGDDGMVDCHIVNQGLTRRLRPTNVLFCADRSWSQMAESGPTTRAVEGDFIRLASDLVTRGNLRLEASENLIATRFFALVQHRELLRDEPAPAVVHPGLIGSDLSPDDQDRLESMGVMFATSGGFSSRMVAGVQIMGAMVWATRNLREQRWGLLRARDRDFLVPDRISDFGIIPLGPRVVLVANSSSRIADRQEVEACNSAVRASAKRYYFAQDLSKT
jgi:hypothetical protein